MTQEDYCQLFFASSIGIEPLHKTAPLNSPDKPYRNSGTEFKPKLFVRNTSNFMGDRFKKPKHQCITVYDDNNPALENVPKVESDTTTILNWDNDRMVYPRRVNNIT